MAPTQPSFLSGQRLKAIIFISGVTRDCWRRTHHSFVTPSIVMLPKRSPAPAPGVASSSMLNPDTQ